MMDLIRTGKLPHSCMVSCRNCSHERFQDGCPVAETRIFRSCLPTSNGRMHWSFSERFRDFIRHRNKEFFQHLVPSIILIGTEYNFQHIKRLVQFECGWILKIYYKLLKRSIKWWFTQDMDGRKHFRAPVVALNCHTNDEQSQRLVRIPVPFLEAVVWPTEFRSRAWWFSPGSDLFLYTWHDAPTCGILESPGVQELCFYPPQRRRDHSSGSA